MQKEVKLFSKTKKYIYCQFSLRQKVNSRVLQGTVQGPGVQKILITMKKMSEQQYGKICREHKKILLTKSEEDWKLQR